MKNQLFNVGDLVQHIRDKRMGLVMTSCQNWRNVNNGIPYCKVSWINPDTTNLIDTRLLKKINLI